MSKSCPPTVVDFADPFIMLESSTLCHTSYSCFVMPHFIQLFCKQFQSISPDLSMHLFVINLCFSDYLATLFSFLDANCE